MAPRNSILSLFDPLHDVDHGEQSDECESDKENSAPPAAADMTMGTFFHSFKPPVASQPKMLKKRLIDFGDVTVDDASLACVSEEDEDEEEDFGSENSFFRDLVQETPRPVQQKPKSVVTPTAVRSSPRIPFGELQVDPEATPVATKRPMTRPLFPQNGLTIAPIQSADSPLASLVDSINAEGVSFSRPKPPKSPVPEIKITSPGATPTVPEFSFGRLAPNDDGLEPPTPRVSRGAAGSQNDRLSLDLQASFQLHFDSPDDSFDLLNDKISFFGHSTRDIGSTSGDEDDYELDLLRSGQPAEPLHDETNDATPPFAKKDASPRSSPSPVQESVHKWLQQSDECPPQSRPSSALSLDLPETRHELLPTNEPLVEQMQPLTLFDEPQTDEEEDQLPVVKPDVVATPAPTNSNKPLAPPPVQALRITKRPKAIFPSAAAERRVSSRPVAAQRLEEKEKAIGGRRPSVSTGPLPRGASSKAISVPITSNGPRRVPITSTAAKAPVSTRVLPGGGPRRINVAELNAKIQPQKASTESIRAAVNVIGGQPPKGNISIPKVTRQVSAPVVPSRETATRLASTIPRPVSSMSRLPAPTFGFNRVASARGAKPATGLRKV